MVCHYSWLANDSSSPPNKKCLSLGRRRPCAKLHTTLPLSPPAQVRTLAIMGRGSLSSLKIVYQPTSGCEEDATLDSTKVVGQAPATGSRMVILLDTRGGGILEGASFVAFGYCLVVCCLFQERSKGGGGGVGLLPCCYCCCC